MSYDKALRPHTDTAPADATIARAKASIRLNQVSIDAAEADRDKRRYDTAKDRQPLDDPAQASG